MYLQFVLHICESAAAAFIMFTSLLYFLESMFKRHHIVFAFLWLISLSIIPSKSIYVAANTKFHSFLWLDITPLDGWMCVCVYMYVHTHIYTYIYVCTHTYTHTYHIFIPSSVDRHWGCFNTLTTVNSAAKNIGMHVSFWISVFSPDI